MIIDATDLILGRVASYAAKKAMLGEKVDIVNCEKAVVTGNKRFIIADYKRKAARGTHAKGPFFPKVPDRLVRRTIRGMLPHKQPKGRDAFKRVMCYVGVPANMHDQKFETIKEANISKLPKFKYLAVGAITKQLSGK